MRHRGWREVREGEGQRTESGEKTRVHVARDP
jgi:hypothetical protein